MKALGLVTLLLMIFSCVIPPASIALDSDSILIAQAPGAPSGGSQSQPSQGNSDSVGATGEQPHVSTPAGDPAETKLSGFRQFIEDQQNAHDKLIVDRFLLGVSVIFAVIAAALLFSLPPKPREQKE